MKAAALEELVCATRYGVRVAAATSRFGRARMLVPCMPEACFRLRKREKASALHASTTLTRT
jgi:hypothetical protein